MQIRDKIENLLTKIASYKKEAIDGYKREDDDEEWWRSRARAFDIVERELQQILDSTKPIDKQELWTAIDEYAEYCDPVLNIKLYKAQYKKEAADKVEEIIFGCQKK